MKVDHAKYRVSAGFSRQEPLDGFSEIVKKFIMRGSVDQNKMSYWQLIFLQSKANGCCYKDEDLPQQSWHWPKNTWLQERMIQHCGDLELRHAEGEVPELWSRAI